MLEVVNLVNYLLLMAQKKHGAVRVTPGGLGCFARARLGVSEASPKRLACTLISAGLSFPPSQRGLCPTTSQTGTSPSIPISTVCFSK
jgi:hypothetical protein